jgi:hypothetical protein
LHPQLEIFEEVIESKSLQIPQQVSICSNIAWALKNCSYSSAYLIAFIAIHIISLFRIFALKSYSLLWTQGSLHGRFSNKYIHSLKKHFSRWHITKVFTEVFIKVVSSGLTSNTSSIGTLILSPLIYL